jgi:two-component system CheB/CheR fusion protein
LSVVATEDLRERLQSMLEEYLRLREAYRQLEASEHALRRITQNAAESLFLLDEEGRTTFSNPAAEQTFGWRQAELLGRRLHDILHCRHPDGSSYPDPECPLLGVFVSGRTLHDHEDHFIHRDGRMVPVVCSSSPIYQGGHDGGDGKLAGAVLVVHDMTERKRAERELARLYQEAQAANEAKDHFLATLSHELRTPLAPVLATVSALENEAALPAGVRDRLAMIRRNVELEARLIDDLLDLTRIARGKLELRPEVTDLRQTLEQALQACCSDEIADGRIRLDLDLEGADHRLWADTPRLTQVFWNLLKNAVKFTPAGGAITVRARRRETPEGPWIAVEFADTGMGIEPDVLPRLFQGFEQGSRSVTRRFGGLGLGLAISKAIVDLHGGRLSARSEGSGRGAVFIVELPVGELPALSPPPSDALRAPVQEVESLHILLVEDHADTAEAMADLLTLQGHRVTVADCVAAAKVAAAAAQEVGRIDLVISDLGLPDGSGQDLMRELVRRWGLVGIAVSGYGMEEDIQRSREAGFALHLTKPVNLQALREAVRRVAGGD